MNRDPEYYIGLPFRQVWEWREDDTEPYWVVRLGEIPGVVGDGASREEATAARRQCLADYVSYRQAEHLDVPEPETRVAAG